MSHEFEDIIDVSGLDTDEIGRLRRIHDLLVEAGPPADLPVNLLRAPRPLSAVPSLPPFGSLEIDERAAEAAPATNVVALSSRKRRATAMLAFAAAVTAAAFGAGYVTGTNGSSSLSPIRVVAMTGDQNALASVRVGSVDASGNRPIQLSVSGLPKLSDAAAYYELFLTEGNKPAIPCGGFRVTSGTTTVQFTVPYDMNKNSHWVVTAVDPANQGLVWPGHVVLRTT